MRWSGYVRYYRRESILKRLANQLHYDIIRCVKSVVVGRMLGVDIDGDSIIVVEVKETSSGPVIFGYGIAELPEEVRQDDKAVALFLQRLLISREIQSSDAVTTLEGKDAFVKHLAIPQMPRADMENSVWWETERTSPFPLKDSYFGYHIIKEVTYEDGSHKVDVVVAAARKEALNRRVQGIMKANLKPVGVTARAWAILAALSEKIKTETVSTAAIIDIGRLYTTLIVLEEGHMAFVREMRIGDADFSDAIRSELGVSMDAAELLKRKHGIALREEEQRLLSIAVHEELEQIKDTLASWDDLKATAEAEILPNIGAPKDEQSEAQQVAIAVRYPVERLVGELNRSLGFYRQKNPERKIQEILLCGRGAMLRDIDRLLFARLALPIRVVNPLEEVRVGSPNIRREELQSIGTMLTAAFGMARKQACRYLNLLPGGLTVPTRAVKHISVKGVATLFIASLISLLLALLLVKGSYASDYRIVKKRVDALSSLMGRATSLAQQIENIRNQMEMIENAWSSNPDWFDLFRAVSRSVVEGQLWLRSISLNAVRDGPLPSRYIMRIEGYARDGRLITEFAKRLGDIKHFHKVRVGEMRSVILSEEYVKAEVKLFVLDAEVRTSRWLREREAE